MQLDRSPMQNSMESPATLNHSDEYYKNLVHAMHQGYVRLEIVFDEHERLVDIRCLEANAAANNMPGFPLSGILFSELPEGGNQSRRAWRIPRCCNL